MNEHIRYLQPLQGKKKINDFGVFDIETRNWITPYAIGLYAYGKYQLFTGKECIQKFLEHVLTLNYQNLPLFAHNAGKFDFSFLLEEIRINDIFNDFSVKGLIQGGGRLIKLIITKTDCERNNTWKFSDSIALFGGGYDETNKKERESSPNSLKALCNTFNTMHGKYDFTDGKDNERPYEYLYQLYKQHDERFDTYLKHDCLGLYEVLKRYFHLLPYGEITLASNTLKTWQTDFLHHKIPIPSPEINKILRETYFGGRTEVFRLFYPYNGNKYHYYDFNSEYPYVMKEHTYPVTRPYIERNPKEHHLQMQGFTRCHIHVPDDIYLPVVPVRIEKMMFPTGHLHGIWSNNIIQKAKEIGCTIELEKSYLFKKSAYLFKEYIEKNYKVKQNSKKGTAQYLLAKLLMNSLYGKFAQHEENESIKILAQGEKIPENMIDFFDLDHNIIRIQEINESEHIIPHLSSLITAHAQLLLYDSLEKAIDKGGTIAYCDTDSLVTDVTLPTSDLLGGLKEEKEILEAYFLMPKIYGFIGRPPQENEWKWYTKAKGFPLHFRKAQLGIEAFEKGLFENDWSSFIYESEEKINTPKQSIRRHNTFLSTDKQRKSIQNIYDKRQIMPDYDTRPWNIKSLMT